MDKYYKHDINEIFDDLNSSIDGLSSVEAKRRLEENGYNSLPKKKHDSFFQIFFKEFADPIIILLIVAIILSFLTGEIVDACSIIFIILVDAITGSVQEMKANKSAEAIQDLIEFKTSVLRDRIKHRIDSNQLVIGDIIMLEPGDKITADSRIIECKNFTVNESILTGESINSVKTNDIIKEDKNLADRGNMLYAGTNVITGRAIAIVIGTGINTEMGKIADKVANTKDTPSPLTIRMNKFSKQITVLIIVVAIIVSILLLSKGFDITTVLLSVVALSVSAMPEGLPLALTMALTIGSNRMIKKNVIVKKLNSVESLGSCTLIASDKTGTLTVNEQTAKIIVLPDDSTYDILGNGYNDEGKIIPRDNAKIEYAENLCELGAINNEATFEKKDNKWTYIGDSIDIAFLALEKKANVSIKDYKKISEIPYESENKYSAVFYKKNEKNFCTIKGSLEKVLSFCSKMLVNGKLVNIDVEKINKQNDELANNGYRIIALADAEIVKKDNYDEKDINNLVFKGLVAFIDPIRVETIESIKECKKAGIKVVMITGDHPLTAYAIAKQLGIIEHEENITTGEELEKISKLETKEFDEYIKNKTVFSRVTPIQKLEIANSYKRQNEFIAITGDGVNDAPAIKAANIGIAMGSGTDVAKETASMIIIDDNFLSIVDGIKEGRNAYSNIRKIVYFLISCGLAEVLFFLLSTFFNLPMPLIAIQLLWLNIVTDGLQDLSLSFEKAEDDIMDKQPRKTSESLFDSMLIKEILISGLSIGIVVFVVWYFLINNIKMDAEHARGYIMALMVFMQNIHVLNCRSEHRSILKYDIRENPFLIISICGSILLQIIIMEFEPLSQLLSVHSIPYNELLILLAVSIPIILVMETYKKLNKKND